MIWSLGSKGRDSPLSKRSTNLLCPASLDVYIVPLIKTVSPAFKSLTFSKVKGVVIFHKAPPIYAL